MSAPAAPSITQLLHDAGAADDGARAAALDRLAAAVYDELHRVAESALRRERPGHTLQPTALVHDAFMQLVAQRRAQWQNRAQFFSVAAAQMRRLLVNHARRLRTQKRAADLITLDPDASNRAPGGDPRAADVLRVDEALAALARLDPRQARIVELRFFAGLTIAETAEALGISPVTVSREWAVARAWLHAELGGG